VAEEQSSTISKSDNKSSFSKSFGLSNTLKLKTQLNTREKSNPRKSESKISKLSGSSIYDLTNTSRTPIVFGSSHKSMKNAPMVNNRSPNKFSMPSKTKQPKMNSYINIRYSEDIATSSYKKSSNEILQLNLLSESNDKLRITSGEKCPPFE